MQASTAQVAVNDQCAFTHGRKGPAYIRRDGCFSLSRPCASNHDHTGITLGTFVQHDAAANETKILQQRIGSGSANSW